MTCSELKKLLTPFSNKLKIKILGTDLDASLPQLIPFLGKFFPLFIKKSLAKRFGWSIWITGEKIMCGIAGIISNEKKRTK